MTSRLARVKTTVRRTTIRAVVAILRVPFRLVSKMQRRRIVVFYVWPDFARKAHGLADLLRRRGFDPILRSGRSPLRYIRFSASRDLWIGFWNEYRTDYAPEHYIFLNGEQLTLPSWKDDENWSRGLRNALEVWDYSPKNAPIVESFGVPFRHVPFGYAPYYESSYQANIAGKNLVEDIDVLFVGRLTERRIRILQQLRERGVNVCAVTRENPAYGAKLDELIARARISLSMFAYDDADSHLADFARLDHLLANRRFVVQERASGAGADAELEQTITTCAYEEIVDSCVKMLGLPAERAENADAAYRWFTSRRALDAYIPYDAVRRYFNQLT